MCGRRDGGRAHERRMLRMDGRVGVGRSNGRTDGGANRGTSPSLMDMLFASFRCGRRCKMILSSRATASLNNFGGLRSAQTLRLTNSHPANSQYGYQPCLRGGNRCCPPRGHGRPGGRADPEAGPAHAHIHHTAGTRVQHSTLHTPCTRHITHTLHTAQVASPCPPAQRTCTCVV